jgi:Ser/Thr protein kinase RdoA (MazF antagonist)
MEKSLSHSIAEGRTAEVYEWDNGYVLKLYHNWCPPHWVEYESRVAHAVVEAGIPAPAAGEIVELNGRRGLVYEHIRGTSMLQDMNLHPWMIFKHAHTLAALQARMHQLSLPGLDSGMERLVYVIRQAPHLNVPLREKVLDLLTTLHDGDKVCHGDFHPGNVMLTDKSAVVIDWMTVSSGNPWADFACTNILLSIGPKGAGRLASPLVRMVLALFHQTYLSCYLQLMPDRNNERKKWMPVIAASRLDARIEPEREALLQMVQEGIDRWH